MFWLGLSGPSFSQDNSPAAIPSIVPSTMTLNEFFVNHVKEEERAKLLDVFWATLKDKLKVDLPETFKESAIEELDSFPRGLALTPKQLKQGILSIHKLLELKKIKVPPKKPKYVTKGTFLFDFIPSKNSVASSWPIYSQTEVAIVSPKSKPIYNGEKAKLFLGVKKKNEDISEEQFKRSVILAEILNRLAENVFRSSARKFMVATPKSSGSEAVFLNDNIWSFIKSLETHFDLEMYTYDRVANFIESYAMVDEKYIDIIAPVEVKTGLKVDGHQVVFPAVHGEFQIRLINKESKKLFTYVRWYQGVSGNGFFPLNPYYMPKWTGGVKGKEYGGKALRTQIDILGHYSSLINQLVGDQPFGGYGITGVCLDSVEVTELLFRKDDSKDDIKVVPKRFPLLVGAPFIISKIDELDESQFNKESAQIFQRIKEVLKEIPRDYTDTVFDQEELKKRVLSSSPYLPGQEPTYELRYMLKKLRE